MKISLYIFKKMLFLIVGLNTLAANAASFFDCPGPACPAATENSRQYLREIDPTNTAGFSLTNARTNKNVTLYYKNACRKTIYSAVAYKGPDDKWITNGWFELRSGKRIEVGATKNRIIYIHAATEMAREIEKRGSYSITNAQSMWAGSDAYIPVQNSKKKFGFLKKAIPSSAANQWTEVFDCQ